MLVIFCWDNWIFFFSQEAEDNVFGSISMFAQIDHDLRQLPRRSVDTDQSSLDNKEITPESPISQVWLSIRCFASLFFHFNF